MPIAMASGIVTATVNVPHGLSPSALTTISPSAARMMIMMASVPTSAMAPAAGPISILTISPSERPSRRIEQNRTTKSCTAPANTTPASNQIVPGR
jgi:hypothetical protein